MAPADWREPSRALCAPCFLQPGRRATNAPAAGGEVDGTACGGTGVGDAQNPRRPIHTRLEGSSSSSARPQREHPTKRADAYRGRQRQGRSRTAQRAARQRGQRPRKAGPTIRYGQPPRKSSSSQQQRRASSHQLLYLSASRGSFHLAYTPVHQSKSVAESSGGV